jgi:glycosyltransferase involved in cell wall biosynthesis
VNTPTYSPPRVLAVLPRAIPSTIIGIVKPLTALNREGKIIADIALEYLVTRARVARADVAVFCRNTEPSYNNALHWALELGKPIIYDLDDNFFELPPSAAGADYHRSPERLNQLRDYLKASVLVRVYSEQLRSQVAKMNPNVERVDGPLDWSLVPSTMPQRDPDSPVRIVYATSRLQDELANIFLDDADQLLKQYPQRVELYLWGYRCDRFARYPSVRFLNYMTNYDRFFYQFARAGFDIGLAPLHNDVFHLSKSNNKFREYAACRIAGIYSNVQVYSECVEHSSTGWLVENKPGAWFEAMERLVNDDGLRCRMQAQAQTYARQHYGQGKFCEAWLVQIRSVLTEKTVTAERIGAAGSMAVGSAESFTKVIARVARLVWRLLHSVKTRGVRQTIHLAQWTLNDLSILFWHR